MLRRRRPLSRGQNDVDPLVTALDVLAEDLGFEPATSLRLLTSLMQATGCSLPAALDTVLRACEARMHDRGASCDVA